MSEMYPKRGPHDPALLDLLDLDRYERAHIPPGPPPKQDPKKRVFNFDEVFMGYDEEQAIVEAASRPTMNFVAVKSVEQQDIQAVHRVRQLLVHQRTALIKRWIR